MFSVLFHCLCLLLLSVTTLLQLRKHQNELCQPTDHIHFHFLIVSFTSFSYQKMLSICCNILVNILWDVLHLFMWRNSFFEVPLGNSYVASQLCSWRLKHHVYLLLSGHSWKRDIVFFYMSYAHVLSSLNASVGEIFIFGVSSLVSRHSLIHKRMY